MIEIAVENAHPFDQILLAARDLGRRRAGYGVIRLRHGRRHCSGRWSRRSARSPLHAWVTY
jgi:hypothetical protein